MGPGTLGDLHTADLRRDSRIRADTSAALLAFPLISRGTCVGVLVCVEPARSSREPRLAPTTLRELRILLGPAAAALDKALLLKRAEALSVTDDLTQPLQFALPQPGAPA